MPNLITSKTDWLGAIHFLTLLIYFISMEISFYLIESKRRIDTVSQFKTESIFK
jgi:hypothetical protein